MPKVKLTKHHSSFYDEGPSFFMKFTFATRALLYKQANGV